MSGEPSLAKLVAEAARRERDAGNLDVGDTVTGGPRSSSPAPYSQDETAEGAGGKASALTTGTVVDGSASAGQTMRGPFSIADRARGYMKYGDGASSSGPSTPAAEERGEDVPQPTKGKRPSVKSTLSSTMNILSRKTGSQADNGERAMLGQIDDEDEPSEPASSPEAGKRHGSASAPQRNGSSALSESKGGQAQRPNTASGSTVGAKGWQALRSKLQVGPKEGKNRNSLSKTLTGSELISEMSIGALPLMHVDVTLELG